MTKKDFALIAEVLAQAERVSESNSTAPDYKPSVQWYVDTFALKLQESHPRFNAAQFEHAAMPIEAERKKNAILAKMGIPRQSEVLDFTIGRTTNDVLEQTVAVEFKDEGASDNGDPFGPIRLRTADGAIAFGKTDPEWFTHTYAAALAAELGVPLEES